MKSKKEEKANGYKIQNVFTDISYYKNRTPLKTSFYNSSTNNHSGDLLPAMHVSSRERQKQDF
jgi:hypothetical protein